MEFMKTKPDKYYDLAIVDPPYGIDVNMNMGKKKGEKARYKKKDWDKEIPTSEYFAELFRVSKNQIVWGGNFMTEHLPPRMCWVSWDKDVSEGVSFSDFELAWTSFNIAAKKVKIPYCGFIGLKGKKRTHPTEKPIKLYRWTLLNFAEKGMKILDTHGGSMTHAIACDMEGFALDICEIDEEYFYSGLKAFDEYKQQLKLF
jgi:site-specific DNA-methyltransferase (adenine-specific)